MGVAEPFAIMSIPPRDLTGRSRRFSVQLLAFVEAEQRRRVLSARVLDQVLRAGTAIGAHNAEAQSATTRRHLLVLRSGALREAREAQYWLNLIEQSGLCADPAEIGWLLAESGELVAILSTSVKRLRTSP
jgi:four helix bundle protein